MTEKAVFDAAVRCAAPPAAAAPRWTVPAWVRPLRVALLAAWDVALIAGVSALAIFAWAMGVRGQSFGHYLDLAPLLLLFVVAYAGAGLYPGFGMGAVEVVRRLTLATSFVFVILAAASFVLKTPPLYSRMTFLLAWAVSLAVLPVGRFLLIAVMTRAEWWPEPALVVGQGPLADQTVRSLEFAVALGYRPRCVLTMEPGADPPAVGLSPVSGFEGVDRLAAQGVRVAIVADEGSASNELLARLQRRFRHVILVRGGASQPIEGVVVRNLGAVMGLEFRNQLLLRRNQIVKRATDVAIGAIGLLLALPVIAAAVVATKLVSRGPAFFVQEREGLGGRTIRIRKLRTMYADAERRLDRHLAADAAARREWEGRFKLARDPRVLPVVGRFLRRFSLDELPQLWGVVRGEMSLVGPRPFPEYHLDRFPSRFRDLRRRVRPGLTGLWQVMIRSSGGIEDQQRLDTYYIRNWSLWMDIYVLGRTVVAVLAGRGAY